MSGLQELFKWESVWKEYSRRIIEIESSIGLWELEVTRASRLSDASKVDDKLFEATNWLLRAVDQSVLTEMEKFFGSPSKENNSETLKGAGSN